MYKHIIFSSLLVLFFSCKEVKSKDQEKNKQQEVLAQTVVVKKEKGENAEIVFCLDATGSMSGLIGTAKEKIWDIVSDLAQSNEIDTLKMGMVFYRDRGDAFVTKSIALTTDLDGVYADLLEMNADGGGDSPESVNQALHEAVSDMQWSTDKIYKTIFVVGDCPPHMDYRDDVSYTKSCLKAAEKGIIINTIKLGNSCTEAIPHFKKMASCTNGSFLRLDQDATDYVTETPYDDEINTVSKEIDESRLYYGKQEERTSNMAKKEKSMEVYDKASATANSARASYKTSKSGEKSWMGTKEIVKDYKEGKIAIEDIEEDELPSELKGQTIAQKKSYVNGLITKRDTNIVKLKELTKKRKEYIKRQLEEKTDVDSLSFSKEVLKIMKKQSKK